MVVDDTTIVPALPDLSTPNAVPQVAIRVQNLGKMYRIYDRPQDRLKQMLLRGRRMYGREFWALRDVSFDVAKGEMVGIIGRNGSGKSTLLQIIAGTLAPSEGQVTIAGRIAALLELGSGFNPEFTGRENVFLNGSILGFSRAEMEQRFDEIAAFADIGQFIEQPVKMYSSGMYVRLAFAVQACTAPDIFIVDEALAVGDVFFRQKCYRRLAELRDRGVSILVVSHAMTDVEQLCQRAVLLHHGQALFRGSASEAVKHYYMIEQQEHQPAAAQARSLPPRDHSVGQSDAGDTTWPPEEAFLNIANVAQVSNGWARCTGLAITDRYNQPCLVFQQGETASFFFEFELLHDIEVPIGGIVIQNDKGVIVHGKHSLQHNTDVPMWVEKGSRIRFQQNIALEIAAAEYTFQVGLSTIGQHGYERRAMYSNTDLEAQVTRICHLPEAGYFSVIFRVHGQPIQLLHHGVANLPGDCRVMIAPL